MIAVIADDFTGAAEIGGIGLQFGLEVVILRDEVRSVAADLLVVATDTRSMNATDAATHVGKLTEALKALEPVFIFKKIDSVLRGNVFVETKTMMEVLDIRQTLLLAGNPHLGRLIKNGHYFVNDIPLHETSFAKDPTFPAQTSDVIQLLRSDDAVPCLSQSFASPFPEWGIVMGDVTSDADLEQWAFRTTENMLLGGGAGFFTAVLLMQGMMLTGSEPAELGAKRLVVFGSAFPKAQELYQDLEAKGYAVAKMPKALYMGEGDAAALEREWVAQAKAIWETQHVILTMDHEGNDATGLAERLGRHVASVVQKLVSDEQPKELIVEGGATLAGILDALAIDALEPTNALAPGVIRVKTQTENPFYITSKPGSYRWPSDLFY